MQYAFCICVIGYIDLPGVPLNKSVMFLINELPMLIFGGGQLLIPESASFNFGKQNIYDRANKCHYK